MKCCFFSGLGQANKIDPATQELERTREWLNVSIYCTSYKTSFYLIFAEIFWIISSLDIHRDLLNYINTTLLHLFVGDIAWLWTSCVIVYLVWRKAYLGSEEPFCRHLTRQFFLNFSSMSALIGLIHRQGLIALIALWYSESQTVSQLQSSELLTLFFWKRNNFFVIIFARLQYFCMGFFLIASSY